MANNRGICVFSGGSAANNLVDVFETVRSSKNCPLSYIIPISDNGGSSSELIRVFGGPGIGDIRSRLVRLIPTQPPSIERSAISALFNHRLSSTSPSEAEAEWQTIVAGTSVLWHSIPSAKKELIRSFFNLINLEILKRSRPPVSTFDFTSASIGNLFLTGARLFSGSFESAIYLLSSLCGIADDTIKVIPAINSNFSHHIAASLANGEVIVGQNSISHPSVSTALESPVVHVNHAAKSRYSIGDSEIGVEDANMPGTLPTLRKRNIQFSKQQEEDLPARIERLSYINPYGQFMSPPANPRVIEAIRTSQALIYSIGSLYTSIVPSIVLRGVGHAIRTSTARHKILILNGSIDREVGPSTNSFTAFDFVKAITRAGEESDAFGAAGLGDQVTLNGSGVAQLRTTPYHKYVTHLIYLVGEGTPSVDRLQLSEVGIESIRLYGRKIEVVDQNGTAVTKGMRYDDNALIGAIETILGKKGDAMTTMKSRRNTLDA
jgi:2-phospho-L-lactate transferase/gluconeogenesis factor (CofD/UPF0052 family)